MSSILLISRVRKRGMVLALARGNRSKPDVMQTKSWHPPHRQMATATAEPSHTPIFPSRRITWVWQTWHILGITGSENVTESEVNGSCQPEALSPTLMGRSRNPPCRKFSSASATHLVGTNGHQRQHAISRTSNSISCHAFNVVGAQLSPLAQCVAS